MHFQEDTFTIHSFRALSETKLFSTLINRELTSQLLFLFFFFNTIDHSETQKLIERDDFVFSSSSLLYNKILYDF